jgi:peptidoglycan/xylan/chitin deacetylase (PgdA/CDA1 family)
MPFYRWITRGARSACAKRMTETSSWPAVVLFYHRVAFQASDDWSIHIEDFISHLDLLQQTAEVVPLHDIQRSQFAGKRERMQVAITFDDGYAETIETAVPVLMERNIPFTYFASTSFAESGLPFPHDSLAGYDHRPNTREQIEWLASLGVEIGSHTQSHANFSLSLSPSAIKREIEDSRKILQDWTGQPIRYFSFPYGMTEHITQAAVDCVYQSGYAGFVSAWGEYNRIGNNPFHLRRIHGDTSLEFLKNWLTLDPRKLAIAKLVPERPIRSRLHSEQEASTCLFPSIEYSSDPTPPAQVPFPQ